VKTQRYRKVRSTNRVVSARLTFYLTFTFYFNYLIIIKEHVLLAMRRLIELKARLPNGVLLIFGNDIGGDMELI